MERTDGRDAAKWIGGAALAIPGVLAAYSAWATRAAEKAVPPDGRFMDVPGARLHFVERGSGAPAVMIHGLGGQLRNFSYALSHPLRDRRVILVDRPGSGYSRSRPMGVADQAKAIATLIARLGLQRPLVVGHSLGGAVALALALNHPSRVGALALIAPLTQVQPDVPAAFEGLARLPAAARLPFAWTLGTPMARLTARRTLEQVFAPEPVPEDFPVRGGALLASRPANIDAASFELGHVNEEMAALVPRYGELNLPVGILYGRGDRVLDPELHGRRAADAIAGARLELTDGGHMIPVTQPTRVATFVRDVG